MTNNTPNAPDNVKGPLQAESREIPSNPQDPSRVGGGFPAGAVERLRLAERELAEEGATFAAKNGDVAEVLAWIDRYVPRDRPDMELSLGQDVGELRIEDPDLEVELIRFNGRTFVEETPAIVEDSPPVYEGGPTADEVFALCDRIADLEAVARQCGERFREYERTHRDRIGGGTNVYQRAAIGKAERNREMAELCERAADAGHNPDGFVHASPEVAAVIGAADADAIKDGTIVGERTHGPDSAIDDEDVPPISGRAGVDMAGRTK